VSAYDSTYPGVEFVEIEGFHDVVVGARVEPRDPAGDIVSRRDDDNRRLAFLATELSQYFEARPVRQSEVKEQQPVVRPVKRARAIRARPNPIDGHPGAGKRAVETPADHHVVFYEKDAHFLAVSGSALLLDRCLSTLLDLSVADQTPTPSPRRRRSAEESKKA
jgi:hypothetical protein